MIRNYLTIALKVLARRKFFTFISLFGISFTLMILMVTTAYFDHSFTSMKPESRFDRVLWLEGFRMRSPDKNSNWNSNGTGYYILDHYGKSIIEKTNNVIEEYSIFTDPSRTTTYFEGEKIVFDWRKTDGAYWKITDHEFIEGTYYTDEDDQQRNFVVVINESVKDKFFKNESALGKSIKFNGMTYKVVGVVKNVASFRKIAFAEVWSPLSTDKSLVYKNAPKQNSEIMGIYQAAVLAKNKEDLPIIKNAIFEFAKEVQFPDPKDFNTFETIGRTYFERYAAQIFWDWETHYSKEQTQKLTIAFVISALIFMLLPSLNLININLSRIMERASEIGVRKAFGASSNDLVLQFVIENVFLTLVGGILGLILSIMTLSYINTLEYIPYAQLSLNLRVFLIGFVISIIFGILSGVYPAWKMSKLHPVAALKGAK
jgi:putative ABC transport system permease protein